MDSIGSIFCGYDSWLEGMAAYRMAIENGQLKVLPVIVVDEENETNCSKYSCCLKNSVTCFNCCSFSIKLSIALASGSLNLVKMSLVSLNAKPLKTHEIIAIQTL